MYYSSAICFVEKGFGDQNIYILNIHILKFYILCENGWYIFYLVS